MQSTNVNIVGQLVESQVTETNLKNLFSKGALGDIVQMYGGPAGYRSPHTMILVGLSSSGNGIIVYDCNSARNGQAVNSCYINQYEISFTELAKNYSISGLPSLLVFKDGKAVERLVGLMPRTSIVSNIEKHL